MKIVFVLLFIASLTMVQEGKKQKKQVSEADIARKIFMRIIDQDDKKTPKQWTVKEIMTLAKDIMAVAGRRKVDPEYLVALLETESDFNKKAKNINSDGTIDRGIWQQNDVYAPGRFWKIYKDKMKKWHYYDLRISTLLMEQRLLECRPHRGIWLMVCYRSNKAARNRVLGGYYQRWLKKYRLVKKA